MYYFRISQIWPIPIGNTTLVVEVKASWKEGSGYHLLTMVLFYIAFLSHCKIVLGIFLCHSDTLCYYGWENSSPYINVNNIFDVSCFWSNNMIIQSIRSSSIVLYLNGVSGALELPLGEKARGGGVHPWRVGSSSWRMEKDAHSCNMQSPDRKAPVLGRQCKPLHSLPTFCNR